MVPAAEPSVETKYSRPADSPELSSADTSRRTAYGEIIPDSTVGAPNSSSDPSSEP